LDRIGEAELAVMDVLWADAPLTAAEVAGRVPPERGWTMATVKTMLGRLLAKGVLSHEEEGRRYLYRPVLSRADYEAQESTRLIDRLFGGKVTPLVAHLARRDRLTAKDIAEIEALLKALKP
jgi:predicted transcriptional regulator